MTLQKRIAAVAHLPLGESMRLVADALRGELVVVALSERSHAGEAPQMMAANDALGRTWVYAYSSEIGAREAGLGDFVLATVPFEQLLASARSSGFGGIMIDGHRKDSKYLIPEEYFAQVADAVQR